MPTTQTEQDRRLDDIHEKVTRIDGALFGAGSGDVGFVQLTRDKLKTHNNRIAKLEVAVYGVTVVAIVLYELLKSHIIFVRTP